MKNRLFSPVLLIGLLGILLISFFLVSKASGVELEEPSSNYFEDKNPWGFYGFKRLLEKLDYKVVLDKNGNTIKNSAILYIDYSDNDIFLNGDVIKWVKDGNTLIIDSTIATYLLEKEFILNISNEKIQGFKSLETSKIINSESLDVFASYEVISKTTSGYFIVQGYLGSGSIILLPDFTYFNNTMFKNKEIEKAYLVGKLLSRLDLKSIHLRERKARFNKNPSFLRDFFTGTKSYITYQLLVIFTLLVLLNGKRFIKPQQVKPREKRKISQHIYAVGSLFKQANAESLIADIDINFFKSVICKNKIPFNISKEKYDKAIYSKNLKEGFLLREEITNELKRRSRNE